MAGRGVEVRTTFWLSRTLQSRGAGAGLAVEGQKIESTLLQLQQPGAGGQEVQERR